ncbi:MAG TPA: glycosyltransferase family 39 protein [Caulobacteraceae bacterium]|nr:glycosyltransferase family 39 protein [Caulobacteraceae bacterium]
MTTRPISSEPAERDANWTWALGVSVVLTLARLFAVRLSPLQLYPDEAQYWLWSRHLEWGYFTKPPLIGWIIRLTTLGGDAEPFVRMSSPLLHAVAGLFLYGAARRLYDGRTALFALLVYTLMPAVQLGAFVVSTDTPLVACLAAALMAYAFLQTAEGRAKLTAAAGFGFAMGLAFLAKYAALYALGGVALHLLVSRDARRAWTPAAALIATALFVALAAPNVVWNLSNGFAAVHHVASEAAWGARKGGPLEALSFVGSQFGVFGPVPMAVLLGGGAWLAWKRTLAKPDVLLIAWALPALVVVLGQAFMAGAKANWAVAAYGPGSILVAAWMLRWGRPRLLLAVMAVHLLVAIGAIAVEDNPWIADRAGFSVVLKGVRGGRELSDMIVNRAQTETLLGTPLTAVAIDERELFNLVAYYGRDYFGHEGPPLKAWLAGPPQNEAQLVSPLTAALGAHVLMVSRDGVNTAAMRAQVQHAGEVSIGQTWTDPKHHVAIQMFVGDGYAPPP